MSIHALFLEFSEALGWEARDQSQMRVIVVESGRARLSGACTHTHTHHEAAEQRDIYTLEWQYTRRAFSVSPSRGALFLRSANGLHVGSSITGARAVLFTLIHSARRALQRLASRGVGAWRARKAARYGRREIAPHKSCERAAAYWRPRERKRRVMVTDWSVAPSRNNRVHP